MHLWAGFNGESCATRMLPLMLMAAGLKACKSDDESLAEEVADEAVSRLKFLTAPEADSVMAEVTHSVKLVMGASKAQDGESLMTALSTAVVLMAAGSQDCPLELRIAIHHLLHTAVDDAKHLTIASCVRGGIDGLLMCNQLQGGVCIPA